MSQQSTDLLNQVSAMRDAADLTAEAAHRGATHVPLWSFYSTGATEAMFMFGAEPKPSDMDPWRLALGVAVDVSHDSYDTRLGPVSSQIMHAKWRGRSVRLIVTYPCTAEQPVGVRS